MKKGVLRNFAKLTGKGLYRVSFLIKLQASCLYNRFQHIGIASNLKQSNGILMVYIAKVSRVQGVYLRPW